MASNIGTAERLFTQRDKESDVHPQRYSYSFSGADARMLVYFPQRPDLIRNLDSVHTLSISVHEAKSQVRSLGYRGIKGLTRSVRTIAGSLILTVVNDHPMRPLLEQYSKMIMDLGGDNFFASPFPFGWSADRDEIGVGTYQDIFNFQNRLSSLLPPFNILMEFVSEGSPVTFDATDNTAQRNTERGELVSRGLDSSRRALFPGAGLMLQNIEIIDEGFVVSVNDMVTEITCSYIARDFKPISAVTFHDGGQALTQTDIKAREWELWQRCNPKQARFPGQVFTPGGESSSEFKIHDMELLPGTIGDDG